jgi:phosphatidylglycerophosphatase A
LQRPDLKFLFARPAHFIALGFGAGLAPKAPGTVGTLVAFPIWWLMAPFGPVVSWAMVAAGFVLGIWACGRANLGLGVHDSGSIVWDEIVAMLAVLLLVPRGLVWAATAFIFFRLFDIWKPFPILYFDRTLKGGFGVMLDDVLAAFYAVVAVRVLEQLVIRGLQ